MSIIPWSCDRVLVWDATCPVTLAPSHIVLASRDPGLVAKQAEQQKKARYVDLMTTYHFVPIGIETTDVFGPKALSFSRSLDIVSGPVLVNPFPSAIFHNRLGSPFSEEVPLQYSTLLLVPGQE